MNEMYQFYFIEHNKKLDKKTLFVYVSGVDKETFKQMIETV